MAFVPILTAVHMYTCINCDFLVILNLNTNGTLNLFGIFFFSSSHFIFRYFNYRYFLFYRLFEK